MLYLDIQNGKKAMKTSVFQQQIGGKYAYTKRII